MRCFSLLLPVHSMASSSNTTPPASTPSFFNSPYWQKKQTALTCGKRFQIHTPKNKRETGKITQMQVYTTFSQVLHLHQWFAFSVFSLGQMNIFTHTSILQTYIYTQPQTQIHKHNSNTCTHTHIYFKQTHIFETHILETHTYTWNTHTHTHTHKCSHLHIHTHTCTQTHTHTLKKCAVKGVKNLNLQMIFQHCAGKQNEHIKWIIFTILTGFLCSHLF